MNDIKYEIIIYWSSADNAFISEVPSLAGCMSDGKTYSEAIENPQVVINQWLETAKILNRTIPTPKGKLVYA